MTGRYLICTPVESARNEKRFDKAWRRFAELCRSLNRDGLSYSVQWNLAGDHPHVLITASGTAKPRRHSAARAWTLPPLVSAQRSRDRALVSCPGDFVRSDPSFGVGVGPAKRLG